MPAHAFLDFVLVLTAAMFFGGILFFCVYLDWGWWGMIPSLLISGPVIGLYDLVFKEPLP
jgi:hypothetical protein